MKASVRSRRRRNRVALQFSAPRVEASPQKLLPVPQIVKKKNGRPEETQNEHQGRQKKSDDCKCGDQASTAVDADVSFFTGTSAGGQR